MTIEQELIKKISDNSVQVGVMGLGYVGLPLAVLFAKNGVKVTGFELNEKKCAMVNRGENYIGDVDDNDLKTVVAPGTLTASSNIEQLKDCDAIIIAVPTPLDRFKKPDMSYIERACVDIGNNMKRGVFISLESTTYPTTTENYMLPLIEKHSGMIHGEDFLLCFSPERVDPGNHVYKTENTPKVVGGLGEAATSVAMALYGKAIKNLFPVSSPRVAEMVKILENTYRLVNISLINEMALLCGKMEIDIWEVIDAARTKPFGFQAFYPGPGIGGHCIPLDPFYLEYIAKNFNFDLTMINTAGHIENLMAHRMSIKINSALNRRKKSINGSKILFIGVAYKPDISDERESPALRIMDEVAKKEGVVMYHDPHVPEVTTCEGRYYKSVDLSDEFLREIDCVVFVTNHSCLNVPYIVDRASLVVDLRNATKGINDKEKIYKL